MNPARSFVRIVMEGAQHMLHNSRKRWLSGVAIVAIGAIALTACASEREDGGGNDESSDVDSTFVFAASTDPAGLDPAFASDGETFRVSRQIFEGLVGVEPGTADPAPLLAESWEQSEDGLSYTFTLKEGVTFHDGTDVQRRGRLRRTSTAGTTGPASPQSESLSYYYGSLFTGFADTPDTAVYESCTADDASHATDHARRSRSPASSRRCRCPRSRCRARRLWRSTTPTASAAAPRRPTLSASTRTAHPTGTGPFKFDEWAPGEQVTLSAYEDYWGEQGQVAGDHLPGDRRPDRPPSGARVG